MTFARHRRKLPCSLSRKKNNSNNDIASSDVSSNIRATDTGNIDDGGNRENRNSNKKNGLNGEKNTKDLLSMSRKSSPTSSTNVAEIRTKPTAHFSSDGDCNKRNHHKRKEENSVSALLTTTLPATTTATETAATTATTTTTTSTTPSTMKDRATDDENKNGRKGRKRGAKNDEVEKGRKKMKETSAGKRGNKNKADFDMAWICAECKEAECGIDPTVDKFLICEGLCKRVFHFPCAGLAQLPPCEEQWICSDCTLKRHACRICQQYGKDDEEVFLCSKEKCGNFFHESCLSMINVDVAIAEATSTTMEMATATTTTITTTVLTATDGNDTNTCLHNNDNDREGDDNSHNQGSEMFESNFKQCTGKRIFTCPAHHCWTCTQDMPKGKQGTDEEEEDAENDKSKSKGSRKRGKKKKKDGAFNFCM